MVSYQRNLFFPGFKHCFIFYWNPEKSKASIEWLLQEQISVNPNFTQKDNFLKSLVCNV